MFCKIFDNTAFDFKSSFKLKLFLNQVLYLNKIIKFLEF